MIVDKVQMAKLSQIPNVKYQNQRFVIWYLCFVIILDFVLCHLSFASVKPRYISLAPSTTEILFALGQNDEIVGVSSFCNYPPKAKGKEKVGTFSQPNIEKILSLKPDIIFCTGLEQAPIIRELRQLNLKVYVSDPANIEGLFNSIREIGKLTGKDEEANILIKKMGAVIEEINSKVKSIPQKAKPRVFVEIWNDPLMTVGGGSFIDELVTLAGGVNIASDTKRSYVYFSPEQVIKRNPNCIILTYMSKDRPLKTVGERLGWQEISAVKNNRVYNDIDPDLLLRPGPRLVEGLKELYKRLYP
jgi:iron complex transport system substrate-binding protein